MSFLPILFILLAPLYQWRFTISGFPLNFLLVFIPLASAIALWSGRKHLLARVSALPRPLLYFSLAFLAAGTLSLFTAGFGQAELGKYLVWVLWPLLAGFTILLVPPSSKKYTAYILLIFLAVCGLLAAVQYFTLWSLPSMWWGNANEPKRAIAFFVHPNDYALFIAPLLAWLWPWLLQQYRQHRTSVFSILFALYALGLFGLILTFSRGAWLALAVAAALWSLRLGWRRLVLLGGLSLILAATVIATVPNVRYRLILPFQGEKSSVARFSLWQTGAKMVQEHPLLGQGLNGFQRNWSRFNTDPNLLHYNSPHNLILNFWVEIGLLGLLSWLGLVIYGFWFSIRGWLSDHQALALFLVTLCVHGFVDTPYLKNDLALVFWVIFALSFSGQFSRKTDTDR